MKKQKFIKKIFKILKKKIHEAQLYLQILEILKTIFVISKKYKQGRWI